MKQNKAFTLIEMSIVLMVIGLVIAGVLSGKTLLYNAQVSRTIRDINQMVGVFQLFKSKYDAWPGDISNATSYWSSAYSGNGNNFIDARSNGGLLEEANAWSHLNLSGLFINTQQPMSSWTTANFYMPRLAWPNAGFMIAYYGAAPLGPRNLLSIVKWMQYDSSATTYQPIMTPLDAYNIDVKMDDGDPSAGNVRRDPNNDGANCISGSSYNVTNTAKVCQLHTLYLN